MRIEVTAESVRILGECHVPGCTREVSGGMLLEKYDEIAETGSGVEAIVGKMLGRMLRKMVGETIQVGDVDQVPPFVCPEHAAILARLAQLDPDGDAVAVIRARWDDEEDARERRGTFSLGEARDGLEGDTEDEGDDDGGE